MIGGQVSQPMKAHACQCSTCGIHAGRCTTVFLGKANSIHCPPCRHERDLASSRRYKTLQYSANPVFRARALERSSQEAARRPRAPSFPCVMCGDSIGPYRGRHRTNALCGRCRIEHANAMRTRLHIARRAVRDRARPIGAQRPRQPWTAQEDAVLRAGYAAGVPVPRIASVLRRPEHAVWAHGLRIGLRGGPSAAVARRGDRSA